MKCIKKFYYLHSIEFLCCIFSYTYFFKSYFYFYIINSFLTASELLHMILHYIYRVIVVNFLYDLIIFNVNFVFY